MTCSYVIHKGMAFWPAHLVVESRSVDRLTNTLTYRVTGDPTH